MFALSNESGSKHNFSGGFPSFAKEFNASEVALNEDPERIVGKEEFMKMELLEDLYVDELRDLYDAEKRLSRTLLRMSKAATAEDLKMAFSFHRKQTKEQIRRLESIFKRLGQTAEGKKCKAMAGLSAEARDLVAEDAEPEVLDAGLIVAAQKMEHYEIAGYGSCAAYAKLLGFQEDAALLHQTLQEEKATDEKLNLLARNINIDAAEGEIPARSASA